MSMHQWIASEDGYLHNFFKHQIKMGLQKFECEDSLEPKVSNPACTMALINPNHQLIYRFLPEDNIIRPFSAHGVYHVSSFNEA